MSVSHALVGGSLSVSWGPPEGWRDIRSEADPLWGHWCRGGDYIAVHVRPAPWGSAAGEVDYIAVSGLPDLHRGEGWYLRGPASPGELGEAIPLTDAAAHALVMLRLRVLGVTS